MRQRGNLALMLILIAVFIIPVALGENEQTAFSLILNEERFKIGDNITVRVSIYNELCGFLSKSVGIELQDPDGLAVVKETIPSEEILEHRFTQYDKPGYWQVKAVFQDFKDARLIYVEKIENVSIILADNNLIIKNTGNVPYRKALNVKFTSDNMQRNETIKLNLGIENRTAFELKAPTGTYDIEVLDRRFSNIPLTGRATAAIEIREKKPGLLAQYPILAFSLFVLLLILVLSFFSGLFPKSLIVREKREEDYAVLGKNRIEFHSQREEPSPKIQPAREASKTPVYPIATKKTAQYVPPYLVKKAEPTIVMHGVKQKTSFLVVNAKNLFLLKGKLSPVAYESLHESFLKQVQSAIERNKGVVHKINDSVLMAVFSPLLKQYRHESAAIKTALEIEKDLNDYNRRLKDRMEFGIGINSGEVISNLDKVIQYTSSGNTVAVAKKVADKALQEVLVTKEIYDKVSSEIKAERRESLPTSIGAVELYAVKGLLGRDAYKSYVTDVLNRIKRESKQ